MFSSLFSCLSFVRLVITTYPFLPSFLTSFLPSFLSLSYSSFDKYCPKTCLDPLPTLKHSTSCVWWITFAFNFHWNCVRITWRSLPCLGCLITARLGSGLVLSVCSPQENTWRAWNINGTLSLALYATCLCRGETIPLGKCFLVHKLQDGLFVAGVCLSGRARGRGFTTNRLLHA
jgi:hypothetical protein